MNIVGRLKNKNFYYAKKVRIPALGIDNYDNRLLAEVVSRKTLIYINETDQKVLPNSNYLSLLSAVYSIGEVKNVVDFGGAAGIHYYLFKSFVPNLKSWLVIETTAMVEQQAQNSDKKLKYCTLKSLTTENFNCDLLYLSGSLQYVEDPLHTLNYLLSTNPKAVLISRTPFNDLETNVKFTQTSKLSSNGPGPLPSGYKDCAVKYEVNVPSYNQVIRLLEKDYTIQWTCFENEEITSPDNSRYKYLSIFAKSKNL